VCACVCVCALCTLFKDIIIIGYNFTRAAAGDKSTPPPPCVVGSGTLLHSAPSGSIAFINLRYSCTILCIIHCYSQRFTLCTVAERNQALVISSLTAAGGEPSPLCFPTPYFPSLTGLPVTSEDTFMNSPLIINVEGGGPAFDLAPRCSLLSEEKETILNS